MTRGAYWRCVKCHYAHDQDYCPECGHNTKEQEDFQEHGEPAGEKICNICGYVGVKTDSVGQCPKCHWDELVPAGNSSLRSALNAMLTQFGMDEDEWNKPTFDQARKALTKQEHPIPSNSTVLEKQTHGDPVVADAATVAGLRASICILSNLVDQQRRLLVEVENVCGRDGHGGPLEDGESELIDRVRAQIAAIPAPTPQQRNPVPPSAYEGLIRDMTTIAAKEVPNGCSISDFARHALADADVREHEAPQQCKPLTDEQWKGWKARVAHSIKEGGAA